MGQWIGGDRDGNPNVTADTLAYALRRQAEVALRHYLTEVHLTWARAVAVGHAGGVTPEMQALAERSPDTNVHRRTSPTAAR
jgi:phosphoenolpyruvate carboxylase